jgi:protein TonB
MIALIAADRHDLQRWFISGAVVLFAHAAAATALLQWKDPVEPADPAAAIVVELAPMPVAPAVTPTDIPPGPEQFQADMTPDKPVEKLDEKLDKIEEAPKADVALVPPKPAPEPPKPADARPAAPATTAPQAVPTRRSAVAAAPTQGAPNTSSSNSIPAWKNEVVGLLERNKRYPADAQARHEHGEAQLAFTLDRQGRVVSSRIARSSGSSALDREALTLPGRAQPFPPPPAELAGAQISLTVPIQFHIR